jgi:uncharacterized protein
MLFCIISSQQNQILSSNNGNGMTITTQLLKEIKKHYLLNWYGTHGVVHWSKVYENGVKLSEQEGVNIKVVQLFSVFHDSQRRNEAVDKGHGRRGAQLALKLRDLCPVNDDEFKLLTIACGLHTDARTHESITIQACFDSDRLDLGRVGTVPDPQYLCTPLAKKKSTVDWGYEKSLIRTFPEMPFGLSGVAEV